MNSYIKNTKGITLILISLFLSVHSFAEGAPAKSSTSNPVAQLLITIAVALLLAIGLLAYVFISVAKLYTERLKEKESSNSIAVKTVVIVLLCFLSGSLLAQDNNAAATSTNTVQQISTSIIAGLSDYSFYALTGTIGLEILVILVMAYYIKVFTAKEKPVAVAEESIQPVPASATWKKLWEKFNSFRPQSEENDILTDHDYDGIRELDNRLPRWWVWGFVFTIVFGFSYLYRYHVAHSAPLSAEELQIALAQAAEQKEEYLKHAANNIDETNVKLLTDAAAIDEGKTIFTANCSPCHGAQGQGIVGPNLTDDYWLHGGSIHDVFKTIKYGYPEKEMKSWKDDFSPAQIAKVASFVKSLHGSNPPNAKDPQGDLYKEADASQNNSSNQTDSTKKEADNKRKIASL